MDATFRAGGLASGLDTNAIIDKLVQLESQQVALVRKQQDGVRSQVSALGDIASRLSALQSATQALVSGGVLATRSTSSNTAFSAAPGSAALAGTYSVVVGRLATSAKALSVGFAAGETVTGGTLTLALRGTSYAVAVADGASLADVAYAIRQSGAPVSAAVLDDGTSSYLSLTARDGGYPLAGVPADALSVSFAATGALGKGPAFAVTAPQNARVTVDGVTFQRTSNTISDAVPGVTLTLRATSAGVAPDGSGGAAETLSVANDLEGTQARLQKLVDAYNVVMAAVQRQLAVGEKTDRSATLAGDSTLRGLQGRLRALVSSNTGSGAGIRSLADLGLRTAKDGSLSLDSGVLAKAVAADAAAVGAVFSTATTGVGALVAGLSKGYAETGSGLLVTRQDNLNAQLRRMDSTAEALQRRVDLYRESLVRQFTAMEKVVSQLRNLGNFLGSQQQQSTR